MKDFALLTRMARAVQSRAFRHPPQVGADPPNEELALPTQEGNLEGRAAY